MEMNERRLRITEQKQTQENRALSWYNKGNREKKKIKGKVSED